MNDNRYSYSVVSLASRHFIPSAICVTIMTDLIVTNLLDGTISSTNVVHQFCLRTIPITILVALIIGEIAKKILYEGLYVMCPEYGYKQENNVRDQDLLIEHLRAWMFHGKQSYAELASDETQNVICCAWLNKIWRYTDRVRGIYLPHIEYYPGSQSFNAFLFTLGLLTIVLDLAIQVLKNKLKLGQIRGFIPGTSLLASMVIVSVLFAVLVAVAVAVVVRAATPEYYASNYKFVELAKAKDKAIKLGRANKWGVPVLVPNDSENGEEDAERTHHVDSPNDAKIGKVSLRTPTPEFNSISAVLAKDHDMYRVGYEDDESIWLLDIELLPVYRRRTAHIVSGTTIAMQLLFIIVFTISHNKIMSHDAGRFTYSGFGLVVSAISLFFAVHRFFQSLVSGLGPRSPKGIRNNTLLHNTETFAMGFLVLVLLSEAVCVMVSPVVLNKFMNMSVPHSSMQLTVGQLTFVSIVAAALIAVLMPIAFHFGKKAMTKMNNEEGIGTTLCDAEEPGCFIRRSETSCLPCCRGGLVR